ncbi:MAG TPA: HepT-like ribonuclease domain-containing protein [bacterium]|nr:HepT-like ribonuclease domain-containing protein [bacterium]
MICQMVIDVCGELSARNGLRFDDYTEAVRNLEALAGFPGDVVAVLSRLPGFRTVIVDEYVTIDNARVLRALHEMEPIEAFVRLAAAREHDPDRRTRGLVLRR